MEQTTFSLSSVQVMEHSWKILVLEKKSWCLMKVLMKVWTVVVRGLLSLKASFCC